MAHQKTAAVIPYLELTTIKLGPLTLNVWGIMVALGFVVGTIIARKYVQQRGGDPERMTTLAIWTLVGAAIGARIFHVVLYHPDDYFREPLEAFRIWHGGWSSLGGFVGGSIAAWLYGKFKIQDSKFKIQLYYHAALFAFPWAWAIGRVGCFLIHDHPGTLTDLFIGVRYPGGARFDLGLMEIINALIMGGVILSVRRATKRDDRALLAGVAWYAAFRFATDFLRATDLPGSDVRWFGLTPAQFGMILILLILIFFVWTNKKVFRGRSLLPS